jgi:hypothetical protein
VDAVGKRGAGNDRGRGCHQPCTRSPFIQERSTIS